MTREGEVGGTVSTSDCRAGSHEDCVVGVGGEILNGCGSSSTPKEKWGFSVPQETHVSDIFI